MPLPKNLMPADLALSDAMTVILHGSYARGDFTAHSDIDLHGITPLLADSTPSFKVAAINGYRVEVHISSEAAVHQKLRQRPAWAHSWLRAEHLSGDPQVTQRLVHSAQAVLAAYHVPPAEIRETAHWLTSAVQKIVDARSTGDLHYAGYLVATNTWELLCGLWQVNGLPIPAAKLTFLLTPSLPQLPPDFPQYFRQLCGGDPEERVDVYLALGAWVLKQFDRCTG
ncbi:MAG: nucleotidyltransferase domain-containing protein [Caldilinea sp. CFX5]|nr:nucleotidyltransferase domain-containing protein [Caldilinea sp. CFX5]